jgi:hypothetical protein
MNNSDVITSLPVDANPPSQDEVKILDVLFHKQKGTMEKIFSESKDVLIVGLLYILFSIPQIDSFIIKFIPSAETSIYILLSVKALIFMIAFFILKNWYLCRK